jgi:hypothetical protein
MLNAHRRIALLVGAMVVTSVLFAAASIGVRAQGRAGGQPPQPPASPRAAAPIELTGYWVSIVNEDYRWRMITPPKGDYASVPLTAEGRKIADTWDPAKDGLCEAYGAGGLMRMPTRLRVTWESDTVLKIETDAGQQTRRLLFDKSRPAPSARSLQGFSLAEWQRPAPAPGGGAGDAGRGRSGQPGPVPGSSLQVVTTQLRPGWLRRNGVPYSENATIAEYFDRFAAPNGDEWLVVTTMVTDPRYLNQDFVTSSHFKKEADGSKWSPSPCRTS